MSSGPAARYDGNGSLSRQMNRYKHMDWNRSYQRSRERLQWMIEVDAPKTMMADEAHTLMTAIYRSPWRMIFALVKAQVRSTWRHYMFLKCEWFRTRVLRGIPDPVLEIAERVAEEDRAISKMVDEL